MGIKQTTEIMALHIDVDHLSIYLRIPVFGKGVLEKGGWKIDIDDEIDG